MELWAEWSKKLKKEADGLITLFHALNVAGIPKSSVQYSVQGMINAFAQLGDLDNAGAKILVGAGVKASWNPEKETAELAPIFMAKGELNIAGVQGKLTGEYNNTTGCWKGSLEAKIPNILPPMSLILFRQIQEKLSLACENKAQVNGIQGKRAEGLTTNCKEYMALAKEISMNVIKSKQSGESLTDLIIFISIEEVKKDGESSYKVDLEVGEGKTVGIKALGQKAEYTTKTKLKSGRNLKI
jgi:hypothetical protein